jgi:hypothetical protein
MEVDMELSKKTTILFSPRLPHRLAQIAAQRRTSIGELVRSACERQYGLVAADEDRFAAARALARSRLPVADVRAMKEERAAGRRAAAVILLDANVLMYAVGTEHAN